MSSNDINTRMLMFAVIIIGFVITGLGGIYYGVKNSNSDYQLFGVSMLAIIILIAFVYNKIVYSAMTEIINLPQNTVYKIKYSNKPTKTNTNKIKVTQRK